MMSSPKTFDTDGDNSDMDISVSEDDDHDNNRETVGLLSSNDTTSTNNTNFSELQSEFLMLKNSVSNEINTLKDYVAALENKQKTLELDISTLLGNSVAPVQAQESAPSSNSNNHTATEDNTATALLLEKMKMEIEKLQGEFNSFKRNTNTSPYPFDNVLNEIGSGNDSSIYPGVGIDEHSHISKIHIRPTTPAHIIPNKRHVPPHPAMFPQSCPDLYPGTGEFPYPGTGEFPYPGTDIVPATNLRASGKGSSQAPPKIKGSRNFGMLSRPGYVPARRAADESYHDEYDVPKKPGEEAEEQIEYETLGSDSYSFLVCSQVCSVNFCFGFFVFMIQITTCSLLLQNLIDPLIFPPNVDTVVRTTQFFAIVLAVVQQDDMLVSIQLLADGYSKKRIRPVFPYSSWPKWMFAHFCRLIEGLFVLLVTFLVIVQSDNVIDLLMNFTAINFISVLDDISFQLCKIGFFGFRNLHKANEIESTVFPSNKGKLWKHRLNQFLLFVVILVAILGWGTIMHDQVYSKYLCKNLYVEFGSNIGSTVTFSSSSGIFDLHRPDEFKNDDRVLYIERRNNQHPDTKRGVFGFCHDEFSWTFSYVTVDENNYVNPEDPGDPCNWVAKASMTGFYDIRNTQNAPWVFQDGLITNQMDKFIILCFDPKNGGENNEGMANGLFDTGSIMSSAGKSNIFDDFSKEGQFGTCPTDAYGLSCDLSNPCPTLEVQQGEKVSVFRVLTTKDTDTTDVSVSNSSIQAYSNPVYVSRTENPADDSILVFAGSHWVFLEVLPFIEFMRKTNVSSAASSKNATTDSNSIIVENNENVVAEIANYFLEEVFHSSSLPYGRVTFISGAVHTLRPAIPLGIDWFYPKYPTVSTGDTNTIVEQVESSGLPEIDLTRPVDFSITCAFCDRVTNPCMYEGVCQQDGRCKCANGATGTFCTIPPVSNGICDPYFNKPSFNYDGGDCCASTCDDPISCGVAGINNAFETIMATPGNGYSNCIDDSMVPITFEFYTNGGGYYFDTKLICNNITYLDVPAYALPPDVDGTEVIYLKDGTDCEVSLTLKSTYYALQEEPPLYDIKIKYGNIDDEFAMVLVESKGTFRGTESLDGEEGTTEKYSFIVLKDCLIEEVPNIDEIVFYDTSIQSGKQYIWDRGTPQGEALRWLNEDASTFSSCDNRESLTSLKQRYLLALINFATDDILSKKTWLGDTHECQWRPGIICDLNDAITALELRDFELTGNIPSEIGLLQTLEKVDFGTNKMIGQIPSTLANLTELKSLSLDINHFSGTIPSEIGSLSHLVNIKMEFNELSGSIPVEFKNLASAQSINMGQNRLTGTLPTEFGELNVFELLLSANQLTGTIPNEFGNLKNIDYLYLLSNFLTGTIPESFGNFTNLRLLLCDQNLLEGTIPTSLGRLEKLEWLNLARNQLSGQIPSDLGHLTKLTNLNLNSNFLTGPIPTEVGFLTDMRLLILWNNSLTSMPSEFGRLTKLVRLYLKDNQLQGAISSEMGQLTDLQILNLDGNFLNGTLPTELGNLINLEEFLILQNQISGTFPSEMSRLRKMESLFLTSNFLSGSIEHVAAMTNLNLLRLDYNQFNGTIPTKIGKLTKLERLSLQQNQLKGSIPSEIGGLTSLIFLDVNSNQLSGTIPTQIGDLNRLTECRMYRNNLSGPVPSEMGKLVLLTTLSIRSNFLNGTIPVEFGRLLNLEQITWSTNVISGKIPSELGSLKLLSLLHASSNQHTGAIPSELGRMEKLGNLDLSINYLTGTIPKEVGFLTSLTSLVLFQNQLSGMPPELGNLINLVDLFLYDNSFDGSTMPSGICDSQLSRLLVDCGTVDCPANCNCRGVHQEELYYSCPLPESDTDSLVKCSKGSSMNLRVEIVPDNLPEETFWDLTINGTVALQGSAVTDNGFETCVPIDSCAYFTIYDQYGDGICCSKQTGFGSYTVFLENTVINYGGSFGALESTQIGAACE